MAGEIDLSNVNRLYTVLLLRSGERHGYRIIDEIEDITGKRPSTSHIYPFLEKLENEGVAEVREGEGGKKLYSLTEEGEELVHDRLDGFMEVLDAAIEGEVEECENCGCEIYSGGFTEEGRTFCCESCARDSE